LKSVYDIELNALDIIDRRIAKDALEIVLEFVDELT
jgi:hypothetical protein